MRNDTERLAVLNIVGLTRALIARFPNELSFINAYCTEAVDIEPQTPGLTCSAQTTYLTGKTVSEHGIVGNGWYFKDLNEVLLWRQSNSLVQAPSVWQELKTVQPNCKVANTFWWYAMNTTVDITLTPRPLYLADGRKIPDCYSNPLALRHKLTEQLGPFPLFHFWGPMTSIKSSQWIADAALYIDRTERPQLQLIYLPHLDYCLQKFGNDSKKLKQDLVEIDKLVKHLVDSLAANGTNSLLLSEYGVTNVQRPIYPNRLLREQGLLGIKVDLGLENLDYASSQAFAVADHQIAHVYVKDASLLPSLKQAFSSLAGVARVLDRAEQSAYGLSHARSGDLLLISEPDAWFAYYFWQDDNKAPDYARTVDIHRKPGYDPCEMFFDRGLRAPKLAAGMKLLKKKLGFRTVMNLISLDPNIVRGSHGAMPSLTKDPSADMYPFIGGKHVSKYIERYMTGDSCKATQARQSSQELRLNACHVFNVIKDMTLNTV